MLSLIFILIKDKRNYNMLELVKNTNFPLNKTTELIQNGMMIENLQHENLDLNQWNHFWVKIFWHYHLKWTAVYIFNIWARIKCVMKKLSCKVRLKSLEHYWEKISVLYISTLFHEFIPLHCIWTQTLDTTVLPCLGFFPLKKLFVR